MEDPQQVIERVGRRIAELREAAELSQAQVAEQLGTTLSNYQRMEHGLQNLTLRTMTRIAGVLGVPVSALLEPTAKPRARRGRPTRAG